MNTKRAIQQKYREQINTKRNNSILLTATLMLLLILLLLFFPSVFENKRLEDKWERGLPAINNSLEQESTKYNGVALEFQPKPFKVNIYTTFTNESQHEEIQKLIQRTNQLIILHELPLLEKDDDYVVKAKYDIIVYDVNGEVLARQSF